MKIWNQLSWIRNHIQVPQTSPPPASIYSNQSSVPVSSPFPTHSLFLGPLLAIPLLLLFGYFSIVGFENLFTCGMRAGAGSIGSVCRMISWRLQVMVDLALLIMCIGTAVSYFSIIGDFIPDLINIFHISRNNLSPYQA